MSLYSYKIYENFFLGNVEVYCMVCTLFKNDADKSTEMVKYYVTYVPYIIDSQMYVSITIYVTSL